MPIAPTYPGVYIEEIPSGVRPITGVATSITAFIGFFRRGPMDVPVRIFNMGDFEREFGGLDRRSEASYAIQQFFQNGGGKAWVVRTASRPFAAADVAIRSTIGGGTALTVTAISPGRWGDDLRVSIDPLPPVSQNRFNMTISLSGTGSGAASLMQPEIFPNLSMNQTDRRFVETVINDERTGSKLVRVAASGNTAPLQTGTLSGQLDPFPPAMTSLSPQVDVTIGTEGTGTATLSAVPVDLREARSLLEAAIRAANPARRAFSQATVSIVDGQLRVLAGPTESSARVTFATSGTDPTASDLGLSSGTRFEGIMSGDVSGVFGHAGGQLRVTIGTIAPQTITLGAMADLAAARNALETQIRAADASPEFSMARVVTYSHAGTDRLIILAGAPGAPVLTAAEGTDTTVSDLQLNGASATPITALVSTDLTAVPNIASGAAVELTVGSLGPYVATITANVTTLTTIADELQSAIHAAHAGAAFTGAQVMAYEFTGENRLVVLPGTTGDSVIFSAAPLDATTVNELRLHSGIAQANVQSYALGQGTIPNTAQGAGTPGNDGTPSNRQALIGDPASKTGMYALEDVDLFNILCIPRTATVTGDYSMTPGEPEAVIQAAINYCEKRRAMLIIGTPSDRDEVQEIKQWVDDNANLLRHPNAALYFPRVHISDPLNDSRPRSIGACGTIAGLYARTDAARGVWKAPAGIDTALRNVRGLDYTLTDDENGVLNPLGINCLRSFPIYGCICWGSRTLAGADQMTSEWKYIPVRRMALYIEESLYRGTQWVVFEPNDEPLWAEIRLNVTAFMHNLFRQGAFQGTTPRDAYLVKCDKETTTQTDINLGVVNILVGFAPLKPAEFVFIRIQQLAGQTGA